MVDFVRYGLVLLLLGFPERRLQPIVAKSMICVQAITVEGVKLNG